MFSLVLQQFVGSLLQTIPCGVICYYLTNHNFRLDTHKLLRRLVILLTLTLGGFSLISLYSYKNALPHSYLFLNILFVVCILIFAIYLFWASTLSFWKNSFIFIFAFNYGLFIGLIKNVVCGQFLSFHLADLHLLYTPQIILIVFISELITIPPLLFLLCKIQRLVELVNNLTIWRQMALFNFVFCFFYYLFSLRLSLHPIKDELPLIAVIVTVLAQFLLLYYTCYILFQMAQQQHTQTLTSNIKAQLKIQRSHYRALTDSISQGRRINHDIRHHLHTIQTLLQTNQVDEALEYLNSIISNTYFTFPQRFCSNTFLNATLNYYLTLAQEKNIEVKHQIVLDENIPFENTDLCIIMGNCLENALDAASLISPQESAFIHVRGDWMGNTYLFSVRNSYVNPLLEGSDTFRSSKHDGENYGLLSIKTIAEKYEGDISIETTNSIFQITVKLKAPSITSDEKGTLS